MPKVTISLEDREDEQLALSIDFDPPLDKDTDPDTLSGAQACAVNLLEYMSSKLQGGK